MVLVKRSDSREDQNRFLDARLIDLNRLEPPLQRRVPLDVLAVLVQRGCANGLELASGERGLQNVSGIDRALSGSRSDQCVQLVDEENAAGLLDLAHNLLQSLFELTPVLRACNQRANVERNKPLVLQLFGNVAADDPLCEALDDSCLAHARFTDERRIVLGPSGKNLHHPVDLGRSSDERTKFASPGRVGKIDTERIHIWRFGLL